MFNIKLNPLWSKTVLVITFSFLLLLSSYVLIDPKGSAKNLLSIYTFFAINFESLFLYIGFGVLVFLVVIAFSKSGSRKIVLEGRSDYSYFSWYSMLFATGMGAALLYWSTYEWLVYYTNPIDNIPKYGWKTTPVTLEITYDESVVYMKTEIHEEDQISPTVIFGKND